MIDLRRGDMRSLLPAMEVDSIAACVTDPPYGLSFMGRAWDRDVAFRPETWAAVLRVLKPGGYLLAFGGTRTYHRLACAIEDAGFEMRDTIAWLYGSGFPKSLDISKAIDRAAGAERETVSIGATRAEGMRGGKLIGGDGRPETRTLTAPSTDAARQWSGWGTALKPSCELVCVARKPLSERTVAANVLRHGTGGINVDACRIETADDIPCFTTGGGQKFEVGCRDQSVRRAGSTQLGRWPANVVHDGSAEVEAAFASFGTNKGETWGQATRGLGKPGIYGGGDGYKRKQTGQEIGYGDTGSASRFFYTAKADRADRADSRHPTVKPVDLMRWLVRLVTSPGGTVLDPFAGSGTTGEAAMLEGFDAILIEREAEHAADIAHRVKRWHGGDLPLFVEAAE